MANSTLFKPCKPNLNLDLPSLGWGAAGVLSSNGDVPLDEGCIFTTGLTIMGLPFQHSKILASLILGFRVPVKIHIKKNLDFSILAQIGSLKGKAPWGQGCSYAMLLSSIVWNIPQVSCIQIYSELNEIEPLPMCRFTWNGP